MLLSGCNAVFSLADVKTDGGTGDGRNIGDGTTNGDGQLGEHCWGTFVRVCLDEIPPASKQYGVSIAEILDTTESNECMPVAAGSTPNICVLGAVSLVIGDLSVGGARPLVLLGTDSVTITKTLDVASHVGKEGPGRGQGESLCPMGQAAGTANFLGAGGAGGSFGTSPNGVGGDGGPVAMGVGGTAGAQPPFGGFRGGCDGAKGGDGTVDTGGEGGMGGGAVAIIGDMVVVESNGSINASGAGGLQGTANGGGGGGGAGGLIAIETTSGALLNGVVFANGGGGGEGTGGSAGFDPTGPTMAAAGGNSGAGGRGGAGAYRAIFAMGGGAMVDRGGGGGGGGVGMIVLVPLQAGGQNISPAPRGL